MNILFLTQIVPYPPDAGPKVKTLNVLRYLVENGHYVTLVSFVREEEKRFIPELEMIGLEVIQVPMQRNRIMDGLFWIKSNFTKRPFLVERDNLPEMNRTLIRLFNERDFDAIHADQLTMTYFVYSNAKLINRYHPVRTVFDAHNATYSIINRMRENSPWFLRLILAIESARIKRFEGLMVEELDDTFVVTEQDGQLLKEAWEAINGKRPVQNRIHVIPIAVDTAKLMPVNFQEGSNNLLTIGTLHYPPNADGIRWFLKKVYPIICDQVQPLHLTVIGKNPPVDFVDMAKLSNGSIHVTGYVEDLLPYLSAAAVMIIPVRAGSGMRVRILEAFAHGIPVVTTTIGLEGIAAQPDEDVFVADNPEEFAQKVVQLLKNPELRKKLAINGRILAENKYDWQIVLRKMDLIYGKPKDK